MFPFVPTMFNRQLTVINGEQEPLTETYGAKVTTKHIVDCAVNLYK